MSQFDPYRGLTMLRLFNKSNLPMTVVVLLIVWAWISLFSVVLSKLF
jgi:hypothetical protein